MQHDAEADIIERLLAAAPPGPRSVAADHYRSRERLIAEQDGYFRGVPLPAAHLADVAAPGDYITCDALGASMLVLRDRDGVLRAFANVCRHRDAPLAPRRSGRGVKALVCAYHGWTYGLGGELLHIPGKLPIHDRASLGLIPLPMACAHGMVWVAPRRAPDAPIAPIDVAGHLGLAAAELDALDLAGHRHQGRFMAIVDAHWILVLDAILAQLIAGRAWCMDALGPHLSVTVARTELAAVTSQPRADWRLRACAMPLHVIAPATLIAVHADAVSLITVYPEDAARTCYTHRMLTSRPLASDHGIVRMDELLRGAAADAERVQAEVAAGAVEVPDLSGLAHALHDRLRRDRVPVSGAEPAKENEP